MRRRVGARPLNIAAKAVGWHRHRARIGAALAAVTAALVAGAGVASIAAVARPAAQPASMGLANDAIPLSGQRASIDDLGSSSNLAVQVWLRPDLNAAERLATSVSTPGSPQYRDFLTPAAYAVRFGASSQDASAMTKWLRSRGFVDVRADAQRDDVQAIAPVATIDAAFDVTSTRSVSGGSVGERLVSRSVAGLAPGLPRKLAAGVLGVTELGTRDASQQTRSSAMYDGKVASLQPPESCHTYWGQHTLSRLPRALGTTTFPVTPCGYTAAQFRSVYGENSGMRQDPPCPGLQTHDSIFPGVDPRVHQSGGTPNDALLPCVDLAELYATSYPCQLSDGDRLETVPGPSGGPRKTFTRDAAAYRFTACGCKRLRFARSLGRSVLLGL